MNDIKVSVILPVFNAEKTLKTAIDSILEQTYKNFELIIINDGSNDLSEAIIKEYKDHRLKYFINEVNKGLIYTLNKAVPYVKVNILQEWTLMIFQRKIVWKLKLDI